MIMHDIINFHLTVQKIMRKGPLKQVIASGLAAQSIEYRTISSLTNELVTALKGDLSDLSVVLQSTDPMVLTDDTAEEITNQCETESKRAATLVRCIKNRVCADQRCYGAFIKVLQRKPTFHGKILEQLKEKEEEMQKGQRTLKI